MNTYMLLFWLLSLLPEYRTNQILTLLEDCENRTFSFGNLVLNYPVRVGETVNNYRMTYYGNGTFLKDTLITTDRGVYPVAFSLYHDRYQKKMDLDPHEQAEDTYDEWVREYRFTVPAKTLPFDTLRSLLEKQSGQKFRAYQATSYSAPSSPWKKHLKGRAVYVYILRVDSCFAVTLRNIHLSIPEGIPDSKGGNLTSVDFVLYKSDAEIEQMYTAR